MSMPTSAEVTGRRKARRARVERIVRAHASSWRGPDASSRGRQTKILRRLGVSEARLAFDGPSIRTFPTCGKN